MASLRILILSSIVLFASCQRAEVNDRLWPGSFVEVHISNPIDGHEQPAYVRTSASDTPQPLIIVLHTWSGDYTQRDNSLVEQVRENDWNFMHPDFRGRNNHPDACCSEWVLSDIDAAIDWAIDNMKVDLTSIHVLGASGGGYATLCTYMRSKHSIASFSAWVPISDLEAWYYESLERKNKYADEVLACTGSGDTLDVDRARERSPLHWDVPYERRASAKLALFAGIDDGHTGSVPISHSLRFFNHVARSYGAPDAVLVSESEVEQLLTAQWDTTGTFAFIGDREIIYQRMHKNTVVTIFNGTHEMLQDVALDVIFAF